MCERRIEGDLAMPIPLTKTCPECQEEMELVTADDVGEILVYECPECGYQDETRIETEEEPEDFRFPPADLLRDDETELEQLEPEEEE